MHIVVVSFFLFLSRLLTVWTSGLRLLWSWNTAPIFGLVQAGRPRSGFDDEGQFFELYHLLVFFPTLNYLLTGLSKSWCAWHAFTSTCTVVLLFASIFPS